MSLAGRIFAATYDAQFRRVEKAGLRARRAALLAQAHGDVLEIGAGTGLNLAHYGPAVRSLTLTEPEQPMVKRLRRAVAREQISATVLRAPAEDLPLADDSVDTVVCTLVLCTVADVPRALREIGRVLRPEGLFLFAEHVRSDNAKTARLQDRMNGLNRFVMHGCNCNRPTIDVIRTAGFVVRQLDHDQLPMAPRFVRPLVIGQATAPALARA